MDFYLKTILLSGIISFSAQAELGSKRSSFKNQVLFERSFEISPEVENWTNVFFAEFFKKDLSNLEIQFSEETDMSFGFMAGGFSADLENEKGLSVFNGDFVFYVDPSNGKASEYGFHFETEFTIKPIDSFFYFIQNDLSFCERENSSLFLSFCEIFKVENFSSNSKKKVHIIESLSRWKRNFITQLYEIKAPEIIAIQDEFVNWIANRIVIKESRKSVVLDIDLSNLKDEFEGRAKNFFKETQLTDYSIESLKVEFFEDHFTLYLHFKKLHVAKRAKLYMELSHLLQSFIEDKELGIGLAKSLRQALSHRDLKKGLFSLFKSKDLINLGWTAGLSFIKGEEEPKEDAVAEDSDVLDSELEGELGLY